MVFGASGASLDNNSLGGSPPLALGFLFNNFIASGNALSHPCRVHLLDLNSAAVILTAHFSFKFTQPQQDGKVGGSTIVPGFLSSGFL